MVLCFSVRFGSSAGSLTSSLNVQKKRFFENIFQKPLFFRYNTNEDYQSIARKQIRKFAESNLKAKLLNGQTSVSYKNADLQKDIKFKSGYIKEMVNQNTDDLNLKNLFLAYNIEKIVKNAKYITKTRDTKNPEVESVYYLEYPFMQKKLYLVVKEYKTFRNSRNQIVGGDYFAYSVVERIKKEK